MMVKRYLTILSLAVLIIFTSALIINPLNYALAQQGGEDEEEKHVGAEKIIEIMEKAARHIEAVFERLEDRGIEIPDAAKESFERGLALAESATQALSEGKIEEAEEDAITAMNEFKEAMRQLRGADVTASIPAQIGIEQAINRTKIFIERLEKIVEKAEEMGYNTTNIRARIGEAKTILEEATILLSEGEVEEAAKKLGEARRTIAGLIGELNRITKAEKSRKIEAFTEKALKRLTKIEEEAEELLPPQAAEKVKAAIEKAKAHIAQIKNLTKTKRLEHAVDEIEDMLNDIEEGDDQLEKEKPAVVQRLRATVTRITNILNGLQQRADRLGDVEGISEIQDMLAEARSLLQAALEELESGDPKSASKTLEKLSEMIDEIDDFIKDIVKKIGEERRENGGRGDERRGRR